MPRLTRGTLSTDFDDNGVSAIMMPALLADACSYEGAQPAPPRLPPLLSPLSLGSAGQTWLATPARSVRSLTASGKTPSAPVSCKILLGLVDFARPVSIIVVHRLALDV